MWHIDICKKLESMGLLEKNQAGDYVLKENTGVNNQVWVGKMLVPRLMIYSFFFVGAFGAEIGIILLSYLTSDVVIGLPFLSLIALTVIAMSLFFIEGWHLRKKLKNSS